MESVSTLFEGERNYFSGTYVSEEADFMAQLLGNFSTKAPKVSTFEDSSSSSSAFWSHYEQPSMKDDEASVSMSISDNTNTNITMPYLQKSYSDCIHSAFFPTSSGESFPSTGSIKKRSCSMDDVRVDWKKTKFTSVNDSDDESNRMQDLSPRPKGVEMVNSNGKKKASSGSTDSQSVYAKKRRERINERLRILQGLVPNGTKVDISTMLEEAVQYVKFLQLQIKLLSSDDMWMYAPLAYNGMDIGLDMKFPSPR